MKARTLLVASTLALALAACNRPIPDIAIPNPTQPAPVTPAPSPTVTSVTVRAPNGATSATVTAGQTVQLTATVNGTNSPSQDVTWTSSEPTVTVSSTGLVTTTATSKTGPVTITATSKANPSVSGTITVTVNAAPQAATPTTITIAGGDTDNRDEVEINGTGTDTVQYTATVRDQNGAIMTGQAVTWVSSDPTVATVDANGRVTALRFGTVTITATAQNASGATITSNSKTVITHGMEALGGLRNDQTFADTNIFLRYRLAEDAAVPTFNTPVTVTITGPAGSTWNGGQALTTTQNASGFFTTNYAGTTPVITSREGRIYFYADALNGNTTMRVAPVNGTYTVTMAYGSESWTDTFTITDATVNDVTASHTVNATSANNTVTATWSPSGVSYWAFLSGTNPLANIFTKATTHTFSGYTGTPTAVGVEAFSIDLTTPLNTALTGQADSRFAEDSTITAQ